MRLMMIVAPPIVIAALALFTSIQLPTASACTDARVIAKDGSVTSGRTMEFGLDFHSRVVVQPRGQRLTSPAPGNKQGCQWQARYGYVYLDGLNRDVVTDGLNEAGLGIGALYLPGLAKYESPSAEDAALSLSNLSLGAWILSQFADTDEVRAALSEIKVWGEPVPELGDQPAPLHFVIHDARGKSIVLEWVGGKLTVYDNIVGVMTNCPTYDWHLANLRNYTHLSPEDARPLVIGDADIAPTGEGSGLIGLPGDPTPPSRFVATAIALQFAARPSDSAESLVLMQKLMNRVDIPVGLIRAREAKSPQGSDYTQWAVFRDHANRVLYWRTYSDLGLRAVDLKKLDLAPGAPKRAVSIDRPASAVLSFGQDEIPVDAGK